MTQTTYVSVTYAYPSSTHAQALRCGQTGCYMVQYRYVGKAAHLVTGPYESQAKAQLVMTKEMVEDNDLVVDPFSIAADKYGAANDL